MKIGDLVKLTQRELEDLVHECGLEAKEEVTKDYAVGVVIDRSIDGDYPWLVHWFPLNDSQPEKIRGLEIIGRS